MANRDCNNGNISNDQSIINGFLIFLIIVGLFVIITSFINNRDTFKGTMANLDLSGGSLGHLSKLQTLGMPLFTGSMPANKDLVIIANSEDIKKLFSGCQMNEELVKLAESSKNKDVGKEVVIGVNEVVENFGGNVKRLPK